MKGIATVALLLALALAGVVPAAPQQYSIPDPPGYAAKVAKQQQKMYKKAAKREQKAAKKSAKAQRKAEKKTAKQTAKRSTNRNAR